jgi:hypothetical protein
VLAAWVRDIPLDTLLRELEARLIDLRLRQADGGALRARWEAVRNRFQTPSRWRIAAPLVLLHDRDQDVFGFVRIELPGPERFFPPDEQGPSRQDPTESRLPIEPFALELMESLAGQPGVVEAFGARNYRVVSIEYRPLDPIVRRDPVRPYSRACVAVTLEADVGASADGPITILRLTPSVVGDPPLAELLTRERTLP